MLPLIPPPNYCDPAVFAAEWERIYQRSWLFAGDSRLLPNHQDYRLVEFAGQSVILQNFQGVIKAFNNVCSHRFARIHGAPSGNRDLRCPYHGWIYNAEGLPYAIPRKPLISEITPATLCEYRLSRWHVQTLGPFLFIRKEHPGEEIAPDDLVRSLGDYAAPLAAMAAACGDLVEEKVFTVKANWKIVVENTLEGYHVDCVHPETIAKLGMAGLSTAGKGAGGSASAASGEAPDPAKQKGSYFTATGRNSAVFSALNPEVSARMDRAYKFLAKRPLPLEGYRHYYCFPSFVCASTRGESFSLQRILPVDEETTELTSFLYATGGLGELSKMDSALRKQFYLSAAELVQAIFLEDVGISEEVQKGIRFAHGRGVLSDEEERICRFHEAYQAALGAAPDAKFS